MIFSDKTEKQKFGAQEQLITDLENLYKSKKFADVILVAQEGQEFSAHRALLSARSPIFAAMFEHESTKEALEGRVVIEDVRAEVLDLLLNFLYTGKVDKTFAIGNEELAVELLAAADKYQIESLKTICGEQLAAQLTLQSMFHFLLVAELYDAPELKSRAVNFIAQ